jgi:CspA family cold shock protein
MNFKDILAKNEEGETFVFTVEMQRSLAAQGLPIDPAHLKDLPSAPRAQYRSEPEHQAPRQTRESPPPRKRDVEAPLTIQIDPQTGKYIGRMKWYNLKKGYGFIVRGGGEEIFFHKSGAVGDPEALQEGQWILYDVEETHKGPEATDVEPYSGDVDLLG